MNRLKPETPDATAIFEELADAYTQALRRGDMPKIESIAAEHPELAARIRLLFPMLQLMEQPAADSGPPPQSFEFPEPRLERLGDYRIVREIGRGGMGIVYQALQESLDRPVALKLLPRTALDARSTDRFQQEARLVAMLHHTNIVPIYGVGQHQGQAYFVMQYIEGQSLDCVLIEMAQLRSDSPGHGGTSGRGDARQQSEAGPHAKTGEIRQRLSQSAASLWRRFETSGESRREILGATPEDVRAAQESFPAALDPTRASEARARSDSGWGGSLRDYWINVARVGCQVASALSHAHSQNILHRDIKPSNLILDETGSVWVTDFGLARLHESDRLTRTGEVVGTLRYMPPEQMSGQSDRRGDVYGLGLVLYEMLVLRPAFPESDHRRLIAQVSACQPTPLRRIDARIPRDLETIVLKAIAREPEKRYPSAQELEFDLNRFIAGEPIQARRIGLGERTIKWCKRHPALALLAVALLLSVLAGVTGIAWQGRKTVVALGAAQTNEQRAMDNAQLADEQSELAFQLIKDVLLQTQDLFVQIPESDATRMKILGSALDGLRRLSANLQKKKVVDEQRIVAHTDLGDLYLRLGDAELRNTMEDARLEFETALRMVQQWLVESPEDPRAHFQHWVVQERLGDYYFAQADSVAALDHYLSAYQNGLAHRDALAAAGDFRDDLDYGFFSLCFRIANCHFRLFRLDEAVRWMQQAEQISAAADHAGRDIFPAESREWYLEQVRARLACWPKLPAVRADIDLADTFDPELQQHLLYDLAAWRVFDGEVDEAVVVLDRLTALPDIRPNRIYDAACGYCRCVAALGHPNDRSASAGVRAEQLAVRAVELLRRDLELGFFDQPDALNMLAADPDLNPLRNRSEFQELIEAVQARLASLAPDK